MKITQSTKNGGSKVTEVAATATEIEQSEYEESRIVKVNAAQELITGEPIDSE